MTRTRLAVAGIMMLSFGVTVGCQSPGASYSSTVPNPSYAPPQLAPGHVAAPVWSTLPPRTSGNNGIARAIPPKPVPHFAPANNAPSGWVPLVAIRPWRWIVVHHSATTTGGAAAFDKMHRAKGWDELGYDFVIGNGTDTPDGQIEVGSRWSKQKIGAHARTADNRFNEYGIGICLVGNFDLEHPTAKQTASLTRLVSYLMATYRISPDRVLRHKDTKPTDCPGRYLNIDLIRRQSALLAGYDPTEHPVNPNQELLRVAIK